VKGIKMKTLFNLTVCMVMLLFNITYAGNIVGKVTNGSKGIGNAVIYIASDGKSHSGSGKHAEMDQKHLSFIPHVLPILAGTTVDFLNSDDVLHNVFCSDACAENFNLGSWPKGETRSYTFKNANCFATILCNVHPEMEAFIIVVGTPYYALSSKNGSYKINNVPAGNYTLKVWSEKYNIKDISVTVPAKGDVTVNF
jgi:plastocyanin